MVLKITPEKFVEKYGRRLAGWKDLVRPEPMRRKPQPQRKLWNEVEVKRSSGTEGSKLTADRLYPKGPDKTYVQAQLEANARGSKSPLGTGVAKVSAAKNEAWKRQAQRLRKMEE